MLFCISLKRLDSFNAYHIIFMMYVIMSETFIKVWFTATPWNFKTNLAYEPTKNPRYNIHCFDVTLIFPKLMPTIHTVWLAQRNESSWVWKDTVVKDHKQALLCKRHYPIEMKKGRFSILIFISNSCNEQVSFIWKKNHNRRYMALRLLWIEMESEIMVWERMARKKKTNNTLLYL